MKRLFALGGTVLLVLLTLARAQAQNDQYFQIYSEIQQADSLDQSGRPQQALTKYVAAKTALLQFRSTYPDWNTNVVSYRLHYLANKIAQVSASAPASAAAGAKQTVQTNAASARPPRSPNATQLKNEVRALRNQLKRMRADNQELESKLKEALSAQPAAVDPRELAKARSRIKKLAKENSLLKVSLQKNANSNAAPSALARTDHRLAAQKELLAKLTKERSQLQARVKSLQAQAARANKLRSQNVALKKQLAESRTNASASGTSAELAQHLADARARVARLEADKANWRLQKTALENRIKTLSASAQTNVAAQASGRSKQAASEISNLRRELAAAQKALSQASDQSATNTLRSLRRQIEALRVRLAVFEAQKVPYTKEELALLKAPHPTLATNRPNADRRSITELPAGAASLAAQARRDFAARRFDQAEAKYEQILKQHTNNVYTLANLAAIELQEGHLRQAEQHVHQALSLAPDDAYSLLIQGQIDFHRNQYDPALKVLSRAAELDPKNPVIQNFLGLTLSEKGLRGPAETALRKAILLDPHYGAAQNNLAVVYVTQKPPLVELARWHYQKALDDGYPHNKQLEQMLARAEKQQNNEKH